MIQKFFEIYNIRFWILLAEILYFPVGMMVGAVIYGLKHKDSEDEVQ